MHEEDYNAGIPEFDAMAALQQRLAQRKADATPESAHPRGPFDPHRLMVQRKTENAGLVAGEAPVQSWPEADIKRLEEFCRQHGIISFNCGTMSPIAALAMLKNKLGIPQDFPKTEGYGPNYPYEQAIQKSKILLKG
jgi:hypothetical protein